MMSSISIKPNCHVQAFQGSLITKKPDSFKDSETIQFITDHMINAKNSQELKQSIKTFRDKFDHIYAKGADKWQNPTYHQFTVTDHMLKCIEQSVNLLNGNHRELDKLLTPPQKDTAIKIFDEKIAGVNKGALFVLAMAFHDLDKFFQSKPVHDYNAETMLVKYEDRCTYFDKKIEKDHTHWSFEFKPDEAVELFKETAKGMNLPQPAIKYVSSILLNHDNPLREVVWKVENGETNITQLFDVMKQKTPMSLKELAMIYLVDQSGKGCEGWLEHLEKVSPWRAMFKSLVAERPLKELEVLLKNKEKP